MPPRYYGRGAGWRAAGEGLRGIGQMLVRGRAEDEDARRRVEDRTRETEAENIRMLPWLMERGGGLGKAPTEGPAVPGNRPPSLASIGPPVDPTMMPEGPAEPTMARAGPSPAMAAPAPPTNAPPRFMELPGGRGYIKTPEVLEAEAQEKAKAATQATYQQRLSSVGGLKHLGSGQREAYARGAPSDIIFPRKEDGPTGVPTFDQAMDMLKDQYTEYGADEEGRQINTGRFLLPPDQMRRFAREMAAGGSPRLPSRLEIPRVGSEAGDNRAKLEAQMATGEVMVASPIAAGPPSAPSAAPPRVQPVTPTPAGTVGPPPMLRRPEGMPAAGWATPTRPLSGISSMVTGNAPPAPAPVPAAVPAPTAVAPPAIAHVAPAGLLKKPVTEAAARPAPAVGARPGVRPQAPPAGGMTPQKIQMRVRARALKTEGKSDAEIIQIMRSEGFDVRPSRGGAASGSF